MFSVRTCQGLLVKRVTILTELAEPEDERELEAFLERTCPSDPAIHGHVCPAVRRRLSLVLSRNEQALAAQRGRLPARPG